MATPNTNSDTNHDRVRWGGTLLGLGALLVAAALFLLVVSTETAPGSDALEGYAAEAANTVHNENLLQTVHYMELFGAGLITAGALMLVTRNAPTGNRIPPSAAWILVSLGALAWMGIVGVSTLAVPTAAANYAAEPVLFETMVQALDGVWAVAGFMLIGGFALALVSEAGNPDAAANRWLLSLGAVAHVVALAFPLSALLGTQIWGTWTYIAAIVGLAVTCLYALTVGFPALRAVTGAARTRTPAKRGRAAGN